jgi:hypothetical protein
MINEIKRVHEETSTRERLSIVRFILMQLLETLDTLTLLDAILHSTLILVFVILLRLDEILWINRTLTLLLAIDTSSEVVYCWTTFNFKSFCQRQRRIFFVREWCLQSLQQTISSAQSADWDIFFNFFEISHEFSLLFKKIIHQNADHWETQVATRESRSSETLLRALV